MNQPLAIGDAVVAAKDIFETSEGKLVFGGARLFAAGTPLVVRAISHSGERRFYVSARAHQVSHPVSAEEIGLTEI